MKVFIAVTLVITYVTSLPLKYEDEQKWPPLPPGQSQSGSHKTNFDLQSPGIATITHTGTFVNNGNNRLDGTGYVAKDFSRGGGIHADAIGGRVDYSNIPSRSVVGLSADHMRHAGTDVTASGTYNFVQTKNAEVGITGEYGRHFGAGGSRPDYGVVLGGKLIF